MAMPQRDDTIEAIKRLDALLEYAVIRGNEAERIREERTVGCVGFAEGCDGRGYPPSRRLSAKRMPSDRTLIRSVPFPRTLLYHRLPYKML